MTWHYSNTSVPTTLTNDISATDTSIQIGDSTGLPVLFPFTLVLDFEGTAMEVVSVTSQVGSSFIVVRGQDGTSAQPHAAGAVVVHAAVARDLQEPQDHIASDQNVHGVGPGSFVVGTETPQVLSNKVIDGNDNTLSNIPADELTGTFGDADFEGEVTIDTLFSGNTALLVMERGSSAPSTGIAVARDSATIGTGKLYDALNEVQTVSLWSVDRAGSMVSAGTISAVGDISTDGNLLADGNVTAGADGTGNLQVNGTSTVTGLATAGSSTVTGVSTLSTTAITQAAVGTTALTVTAITNPTAVAVRVIGGTGAAGLEVRRNNSTVTGNLQMWADESGGSLIRVTREGQLNATQPIASTSAVSITAHASATTPAVLFTGTPAVAALRVARNNATTTGDLQTWVNESNTTIAAARRNGALAGTDIRVLSPDISLLDPPRLSLQKTNSQTINNLTDTPIVYNVTVKNVGGFTYNTSTGQINVPVNGFYLITSNVQWTQNVDAGVRGQIFVVGATTYVMGNMLATTGGSVETQSGALMVDITTGQACFLEVSHNSGGTLTIGNLCTFTIRYMGPS